MGKNPARIPVFRIQSSLTLKVKCLVHVVTELSSP